MWVTKLLISPVKKRIFCSKTTKFGPKLAFVVDLGQAMQAFSVPCWWVGWWLWRAGCISQDTYLLYTKNFLLLVVQDNSIRDQVTDWVNQSVSDIFYFSVFREHCRSLDKDKKQRQRHWERLSDLATLGQSWLFQTNWETPITTLSLRVIDRQSESDLDNNRNSGDVFIIYCEMQVFRC